LGMGFDTFNSFVGMVLTSLPLPRPPLLRRFGRLGLTRLVALPWLFGMLRHQLQVEGVTQFFNGLDVETALAGDEAVARGKPHAALFRDPVQGLVAGSDRLF